MERLLVYNMRETLYFRTASAARDAGIHFELMWRFVAQTVPPLAAFVIDVGRLDAPQLDGRQKHGTLSLHL